MDSKTRIVATIGPASEIPEVLQKVVAAGADIIRFNFAWADFETRLVQLANIQKACELAGRPVEIMADLPRSRVQEAEGHTYDKAAAENAALTENDKEILRFSVDKKFEYVALSFVGSEADIHAAREYLDSLHGTQKIIAKIERKVALDKLESIIAAADMVMVARGDLGDEIPLEEIPFAQHDIIVRAAAAGKPAIVATQMMLSMTEHAEPTRAEVSDVTTAVLSGAWGVMLSEESASGKYPAEAVAMMRRIVGDAQRHLAAGEMGKLIIARHHESEWNKEGRWTGTRDVHLTPYGFKKSEEMGQLLHDVRIDHAFASMQVRSIETLASMLMAMEFYHVPTEHSAALNERDYGDYTGKNKWEVEKLIGQEAFDHIRRDWECPVQGGETLKMVYERAVPYFTEKILPLLAAGQNILIVSHGNALRALMLYIEQIPKEDAPKVEMLFGAVVLYTLDAQGHSLGKEVRTAPSEVNA